MNHWLLKMEFLERLRKETRHIHEEIERASLFSRIINHNITLPEYHNLMLILHDFIAPREKIIKAQYPDFIAGREKTPLLEYDLLKMGVDFTQSDYQYLNTNPFNAYPDVFGYLYVIEGATLGGQVIKKCLMENNKLNHAISMRYFNSYDDNTKKNWTLFLHTLTTQHTTCEFQQSMIQSAKNIFTDLLIATKI